MQVLAGDIVVGKPVALACARHLSDIQTQTRTGLQWRPEAAQRAVDFIEQFCTVEVANEVVPFKLLLFQAFIVGSLFGWFNPDGSRRFRNAYIEMGKGPLAIDTSIPTPIGWTTMANISVGDQVFDERGIPCVVTDVSDVFSGRKCFRLQFSDGCEITADADHQWLTCCLRSGGEKGPKPLNLPRKNQPAIWTTENIANTYRMKASRSIHPQARWNHRVPVCGPLKLNDADLPIPPYTLGIWLGDGNSHDARMTVAFDDWQIIEEIQRERVPAEARPNRRGGLQSETTCKVQLGSMGRTQKARGRSLDAVLRKLGLLGNKHIPEIYLRSSIEQRMSLLQGLMDSDGTISQSGYAELSFCHQPLVFGAIELLRSLGFKPTCTEGPSTLNGRIVGHRWRIKFQPYKDMPPFRLARKRARLRDQPKTKSLSTGRMIVGCDPVASEPVRCISVNSKSQLFLAGDGMIPTHNSGKTPLAAAIALYGLIADGQVSPEIYFAAVTREQANIGFRDAKAMAERSEEIKSLLDIREAALLFPERNGVLRAVSSEHRGLDGKRPHVVIVDELHEHPTGLVVDKMRAGTKNRTNAMIIRITNSGSDLESVCWHEHEYSMSVLEAKVKDPSWFGYICSLDKGDDWTDPACWEKTNPGLGTILPRAYLTEQVREAQGMPSKQNIVKRLNFCIWTQQHTLWIPIEQWERCKEKFDHAELEGEPCWVGLDLSDKLDLSTAVFVFKYPIEQEIAVKVGHRDEINPHEEVEAQVNIDFGIDILPFFFIPEETMHQREKEDRVPYSDWERNGFVIATPGQIIDYGYIYRTVLAMSKRFSIQQIGYDPRGATQLAIQLGEAGFEMVELTQGFNNMSEPAQIFEALVAAGRVRHNGHPVMTWNVQNSAVKHSKDNRMIIPYKSHARKRIDGVTGVCMALGRAMVAKSTGSVYESRGILRL